MLNTLPLVKQSTRPQLMPKARKQLSLSRFGENVEREMLQDSGFALVWFCFVKMKPFHVSNSKKRNKEKILI